MQKLAEAVRPIVPDIGARDAFKRGHWPGAVNIPVDELPVRAGIELAGSKRGRVCQRTEPQCRRQWRRRVTDRLQPRDVD
jgi:hypothetical protein